jgi:hypothetical protein
MNEFSRLFPEKVARKEEECTKNTLSSSSLSQRGIVLQQAAPVRGNREKRQDVSLPEYKSSHPSSKKLDHREKRYNISRNFPPMFLFKPKTNANRSQDKRQLS